MIIGVDFQDSYKSGGQRRLQLHPKPRRSCKVAKVYYFFFVKKVKQNSYQAFQFERVYILRYDISGIFLYHEQFYFFLCFLFLWVCSGWGHHR